MMKRSPRNFSQKGLTMLEVIIGCAFLVGIGLTTSTVLSMLTRVEQNTRAIADIQTLEALIKQQLAKVKVCKEVMGARDSLSNPAGTVITPKTVGSVMPYSLFEYNQGSRIFIGANPSLAPSNNIHGHIQITNTTLEIAQSISGATMSQVIAHLHFAIKKQINAGGLGAQTTDVYIPVNLVLNASDVLISCSLIAADTGIPQCGAGQHVVLNYQSGAPMPIEWTCQ